VKIFIKLSEVRTQNGYPLQITGGSRIHLRTILVFHYSTDNELCSAAAHRSKRDAPDPSIYSPLVRVRRQTAVDRDVMTQELVDAILAYEDKLVQLFMLFHF